MLGRRLRAASGADNSYRYFRVYITNTNSIISQLAGASEIEIIDSTTLIDITTPSMTAIGSTQNSALNSYAKAFDNDFATGWFSASGAVLPQWIGIDLGFDKKASEIDSITIRSTASTNATTTLPIDFEFQGSNDQVSWVTLLAVSGEPAWSNSETRSYTL